MSVTTDRGVRLFKRDPQAEPSGRRPNRFSSVPSQQALSSGNADPARRGLWLDLGTTFRRRHLGPGGGLPNRDVRGRVQPRTAAALHRYRPDRRQHRPWAQGIRGRLRLAAVRARAGALRPQSRRGRHARCPHTLAIPTRRRPLALLRHCADGLAPGAHQDAAATVVGSDHQQHLHVVFHPAVCGRRRALAAQPDRLGGIRPPLRCAVVWRGRRIRGATGSSAVGSRALHPGGHRRWPVQPALHVPNPCRRPRRRIAGLDAHEPARRQPVRGADFHARLGNAAYAVG